MSNNVKRILVVVVILFSFLLFGCKKKYIVAFDSNGGSAVESQNVEKGKNASKPEDPTKEGYIFEGWYVDDEKWSFSGYVVIKDITLVAKWVTEQYNLTIKYNDGKTPDFVSKKDVGSNIDISVPSKDGYTFDKWNIDVPAKMPSHDLTLEAIWKVNQYNLIIQYDDGVREDLVIKQDYDSLLNIEAPEREGYIFDKWDIDVPTNMPSHDLTIKAIWKISQYSITIKYNDEKTEDLIISQDPGTMIAISNPLRSGYYFDKWSQNIPNVMPKENITIEAIWKCDISYSIENDEVVITGCNKQSGEVVILDKYEGKTTTTIAKDAFNERRNITSVELPNTITKIDDYAFYRCIELESINFPNGLTYIGQAAFTNCIYLTSAILPDSVVYMGGDAFSYCNALEEVVLSNKLSTIESGAFRNCNSLKSIAIPDSVTNIESMAFDSCENLESITIPNGVSNIGTWAFSKCKKITNVTIPASVLSIGTNPFTYCESIVSITVDANNTIYDSRDNCNGVIKTATNSLIIGCKNTVIPENVVRVGQSAFCGCTNLSTITIPEAVTSIGNSAFMECHNLQDIIIPSNVEIIDKYAFWGCDSFKNITVSKSISTIGEQAFYHCDNIEKIIIPISVVSIGSRCFQKCPKLTIYCESDTRPKTWDSRWNDDGNSVIYGYKEEN